MSEDHICLIRKGNEEAFRQLFTVLYPRLVQFSKSFIKSVEIAEDIVMEVFVKFWQAREKVEGIKDIETYLFISVRNETFSTLKKEGKYSFETLDDVDVLLKKYQTNPEMLMITEENIGAINEAIDLLPPKCKMVFKLIREEGLDKRQASRILNISVKTIDNQIAIAVKKIAGVLNIDLTTGNYSSHIQMFLLSF